MPQPVIALLTDFGTSDPYVGIMKGVILARCLALQPPLNLPIQIVDITHEVRPQNVRQAAYLLRSAYRYFPPHTIYLVVVDPGVGTERKPLAIETDRGIFVGPDNGVFGHVLAEAESWQAVALWPPENVSATFHGRDVFAPAAAALACGEDLLKLGTPTTDVLRLEPYRLEMVESGQLTGEVIHIDHFGNVITSLGPFEWSGAALTLRDPSIRLEAASADIIIDSQRIAGIHATYGDLPSGELMAVINSDRQLEIAVNQGNAARQINAEIGQGVTIIFKPF